MRAPRAKEWKLVDVAAKSHEFGAVVKRRAAELAATSDRPAGARGVELTPLERSIDGTGYHYRYVDVRIDRDARNATVEVSGPAQAPPADADGIFALGTAWWPFQMARELDDAILLLRTNDLEIGMWQLQTRGDPSLVLAADAALIANQTNWFVREVAGMLRRTLARLEVSSRSLFAIVDRGSCFAGTLLELALAADRAYMLDPSNGEGPELTLSDANFGFYPQVNGLSRLETRFCGDRNAIAACRARIEDRLDARASHALGLVTVAPAELDWDEELRLALEERASLSPDALSGLEANLRFPIVETIETRIFGRLSAWQNWIFSRPNAAGEAGALKVFGKGSKAKFDRERV